jgi:hypothetical protein
VCKEVAIFKVMEMERWKEDVIQYVQLAVEVRVGVWTLALSNAKGPHD